jgi:hypothetical protein
MTTYSILSNIKYNATTGSLAEYYRAHAEVLITTRSIILLLLRGFG